MKNLIIDDLPVSFNGVSFNSDFKAVLRFLRVLQDEKLEEKEKALLIAEIFFNNEVPNSEKVWDFIKKFTLRSELKDDEDDYDEQGEKNLDFLIDSGLIFSSFFQAYNINLRETPLHWWLFVQLLEDLPADTALMRVIHIRQEKEKPENGKEYNARLRKAKDRYRLYTPSLSGFFGD